MLVRISSSIVLFLINLYINSHYHRPGHGEIASWNTTLFQAAQMTQDGEWPLIGMDSLVATQLQEMEMVRQKVYNLEQTQIAIKQR